MLMIPSPQGRLNWLNEDFEFGFNVLNFKVLDFLVQDSI